MPMKRLGERELGALSRATGQIGLIGGINAKGFLIDLEYALEYEAGLKKVSVRKTGEPECRFRVSALYEGDAEQAAHRILAVFEGRIAYSSEDAVVAWTISDGTIQFSFLTQAATIGVATVCLRAGMRD